MNEIYVVFTVASLGELTEWSGFKHHELCLFSYLRFDVVVVILLPPTNAGVDDDYFRLFTFHCSI